MSRSPRVLIVLVVLALMLSTAWLWTSAGALGQQFKAVPGVAAPR